MVLEIKSKMKSANYQAQLLCIIHYDLEKKKQKIISRYIPYLFIYRELVQLILPKIYVFKLPIVITDMRHLVLKAEQQLFFQVGKVEANKQAQNKWWHFAKEKHKDFKSYFRLVSNRSILPALNFPKIHKTLLLGRSQIRESHSQLFGE